MLKNGMKKTYKRQMVFFYSERPHLLERKIKLT
jgi:hypothetical protein